MGLQLRMTFNDADYVYEIINSRLTDQTTELELVLEGEKIELLRDKNMVWIQKDGVSSFDPGLIQALGRSASLRLRV